MAMGTMALHVRQKACYISQVFDVKQKRKITNFRVLENVSQDNEFFMFLFEIELCDDKILSIFSMYTTARRQISFSFA